jgi:hypothetical protein
MNAVLVTVLATKLLHLPGEPAGVQRAVLRQRFELGALTQSRSPFGALTQSRSPFGALTQSRSPFGAFTQPRSPFPGVHATRLARLLLTFPLHPHVPRVFRLA